METDFKKKKDYSNIIIYGLIILIIIVGGYLYFIKNKTPEIVYSLSLNGETFISINEGEEYFEPGFNASDQNGNNLNGMVIVTGNVNTEVPGTYQITYQIGDKFLKRIIEVKEVIIDKELTLDITKDKIDVTNQDIIVSINITGETFAYLILPDGTKAEGQNITFTVTDNGTYEFAAYNTYDEVFKKEIVIDNIDKIKPTGTCEATINNSNSSIKVNATDNNNQIIYNYYDNNNLLNSSENNNYISTTKTSQNISVLLKDMAGNEGKITCQIVDNTYYEPVVSKTGGSTVYDGNSETLKVHIEKKDAYYLTYVWMKNPYMQIRKMASPEYGSKLYTSDALLSKLMASGEVTSKIAVAFNASGFYLKGRFDNESVEKYAPYNKTSVGTIVINEGKLVRNFYDHADKTWFITGINKENKMVIFEDTALGGNVTKETKKVWADTVINSGIRNTFTFAAPIIQNGKETNITTSMPDTTNNSKKGLQLMCQINDNNFVLFTANSVARNTGIKTFLDIGCQTAINLDGGGSVRLYYKEKASNNFKKVIIGNDTNREFPEIGYFTE